MKIPVITEIFEENNKVAAEVREILKQKKVFLVNLMASPGTGKTSLITAIIEELKGRYTIGVIEGDIATSIDAEKIGALGIPVVQINTGGGCHLDAGQIKRSFEHFDLDDMDILFIENVGNLICPADYDLGENIKWIMSNITEGFDKPHKYPQAFSIANGVLLNKMDLAHILEFDYDFYEKGVRLVNKDVPLFKFSCKTKEGISSLCDWLVELKCAKG